MPLAFFTWQKRQRSCRLQCASISRIALLWKNNPAKIDTASAAHTEDKKKGQQKEKSKEEGSQEKGKAKESNQEEGKDKSGKGDDKDKSGKSNDKEGKGEKKEEQGKTDDKKEEKPRKPGTLGDLLKDPDVAEDEKPEKPPAARIVAYSDSEGEDEPFRLTRRKKKKKEEDGHITETEEEVEDSQNGSSTPVQAIHTPRLLKSARASTRKGVTKLQKDAGWGFALQFLMLWLFRRRRRKEAQRFELLTLAISLPDALSCSADWGRPSNKFPSKIPVLIQFLESWARPAAIFQLERLVRRLTRKKKRRRILTTISQSARLFEEAEQTGNSTPGRFKNASLRLAKEIASTYKVELAEMRRILQEEHHTKLSSERFDETNAELLRFAASAGLLEAYSPEEKAHAIQEGAERILKTLDWIRRRKFMTPTQLKDLHHVVRWQGTNTEGWPILVVKIAMACAQYQGDESNTVADAIIGQMQRALTEVLSDQRGPDKVVVILDASNASSLQAARHVAAFKETAVALNRHYPMRLEKLFIVDLPSQLRWVLATLRNMLHPDTKHKIHLVSINDPALPLPKNLLQTPEEQAMLAQQQEDASSEKARRVSIPALPISRTPPIPLNASLTRLFDHRIEEEEKESPEKKGGLPSPPRRRVRIMELPYREFERKNSGRGSFEKQQNQLFSPGTGVMRPALKRSTSVGLLDLDLPPKREDK